MELGGLKSMENKVTPDYILEFVNNLHKKGWEQKKFEDPERILNHNYFILREISINDSSVKWCKGMHYPVSINYSKISTEIPPIVIDSEGYIIDGCHRSNAKRIKNDKTIFAYIGIK